MKSRIVFVGLMIVELNRDGESACIKQTQFVSVWFKMHAMSLLAYTQEAKGLYYELLLQPLFNLTCSKSWTNIPTWLFELWVTSRKFIISSKSFLQLFVFQIESNSDKQMKILPDYTLSAMNTELQLNCNHKHRRETSWIRDKELNWRISRFVS